MIVYVFIGTNGVLALLSRFYIDIVVLALKLEFVCYNPHYVVREPVDPLGPSQTVVLPIGSFMKATHTRWLWGLEARFLRYPASSSYGEIISLDHMHVR